MVVAESVEKQQQPLQILDIVVSLLLSKPSLLFRCSLFFVGHASSLSSIHLGLHRRRTNSQHPGFTCDGQTAESCMQLFLGLGLGSSRRRLLTRASSAGCRKKAMLFSCSHKRVLACTYNTVALYPPPLHSPRRDSVLNPTNKRDNSNVDFRAPNLFRVERSNIQRCTTQQCSSLASEHYNTYLLENEVSIPYGWFN